MVAESVDIKHDYKTTFVISIVLFIFMFLSGFVLTAGGGSSDQNFINRFTLYSILGGVGLAFIFSVNIYNLLFHVRGLKTIVHEPEESLLKGLKVTSNPFLLVLLTFILFTIPLYFMGKVSNTFFSSIPFVSQSATSIVSSGTSVFANIWSDAIFPALAENLFIFIALALVYTWNFKKNYKSRKGLFYVLNLLVIPVVFAFLWQLFHMAIYGSSQSALAFVFVFGLFGVFVSMLTMSILPWAIIHFLTNFMVALQKYNLMSSDNVFYLLLGFEVLCIVLFIVVYRLDKKRY